jgi:hypothetical protein
MHGGARREPAQLDPQTEEALVASKLDHLAAEYSQLLVGQLEQQRGHYEALLQRSAEEAEAARREALEQCAKWEASAEAAQQEAKASERGRRAAEQKLVRGCMAALWLWGSCWHVRGLWLRRGGPCVWDGPGMCEASV